MPRYTVHHADVTDMAHCYGHHTLNVHQHQQCVRHVIHQVQAVSPCSWYVGQGPAGKNNRTNRPFLCAMACALGTSVWNIAMSGKGQYAGSCAVCSMLFVSQESSMACCCCPCKPHDTLFNCTADNLYIPTRASLNLGISRYIACIAIHKEQICNSHACSICIVHLHGVETRSLSPMVSRFKFPV